MTDLLLASWARRAARTGLAREIREASMVSIHELSSDIGCSPGSLSRWERGIRSPRQDYAEAWAERLRGLAGLES